MPRARVNPQGLDTSCQNRDRWHMVREDLLRRLGLQVDPYATRDFGVEHQNGIADIVGDIQLIPALVEKHLRGPVQLRFTTHLRASWRADVGISYGTRVAH